MSDEGGNEGGCGLLAGETDWASRIWIIGDSMRVAGGGVVGMVSTVVNGGIAVSCGILGSN